MGSGNTHELSYPSLVIIFLSLDWQRGARGDFMNIILKSPFIPLCQRGIKITEALPSEVSLQEFLTGVI